MIKKQITRTVSTEKTSSTTEKPQRVTAPDQPADPPAAQRKASTTTAAAAMTRETEVVLTTDDEDIEDGEIKMIRKSKQPSVYL